MKRTIVEWMDWWMDRYALEERVFDFDPFGIFLHKYGDRPWYPIHDREVAECIFYNYVHPIVGLDTIIFEMIHAYAVLWAVTERFDVWTDQNIRIVHGVRYI